MTVGHRTGHSRGRVFPGDADRIAHELLVGVFPAMVVIALGMAGAVAPLTTAMLVSVDSHHTGTASRLNSAVARTGGLVATALIGPVMASSGPALLSAFGVAGTIGRTMMTVAPP
jgi:hypothetical protein